MFNYAKGSLILTRMCLWFLFKGTLVVGKKEEKLWLEEKRVWISGQGEDSTDLDKGEAPEFEYEERMDEILVRLFQQVHTRKNK